MKPAVTILLSTCDAYEPVARLTLRLLDAWWPGHPPVVVCGLKRSALASAASLPFEGDPRDWIGITLQAVSHLERQGMEWLYLILDDHPPVGPCQVAYLNERLPELAARMGALHVNLQGWDQHQPQAGELLDAAHLGWQRNAHDFRWKFSLHPGFWHVPSLVRLLTRLRADQPAARSARAFEGSMDQAARAVNPEWCARTYRVRGDGFAAGRRSYERACARKCILNGIHLLRFGARLMGGGWLARLDQRLLSYLRYINGPYPMFWSGLIQAGMVNQEAVRFLRWSGQAALADEVCSLSIPGRLTS